MPLETIKFNLLETLGEALETMAFVSLTPMDEPGACPPGALLVSVRFSGPIRGAVELVASGAFGVMLAGNILGTTPDDPDAAQGGPDALKELMNVVCGVLIKKSARSPDAVFEMAVPRIVEFDGAAGWADFIAQPGCAVVDADGFPIAARVKEFQ